MKTRLVLLAAAVLSVGLSTPSPALVGSALSLDGKGSYVEVAPHPELHSERELTVTGWFRTDDSQTGWGWQALFWKGNTPDHSPFANREYGLWLSGNGRLQLHSTPADPAFGSALMLEAPEARIQPGQWYHFATVISASEDSMRLYLNGRPLARRGYSRSGIRTSVGPLRLGGIPDRDYFNGLLDEVQVWNRALSQREIARLLHAPVAAGAPGLVAAYTFDKVDEEGNLPDASGRGHTGRLCGQARLVELRVFTPPLSARSDTAAAAGDEELVPPPIRGETADLLILALRSDDYQVRRHAAGALNQVAPDDFARVVKVALASRDYQVRTRAAEALTRLSSVPHADGNVELMVVRTPQIAWLEALDRRVAQERVATKLARPTWHGEVYRGWEERWHATRPEYWQLELDGPVVRYNRVEGIYVGWRLPRTYRPGSGLTHFGSGGYGLASEDLCYRAGGELYTFYSPSLSQDNLAAVGGELHDLTDTQDAWLLPEEENTVDALLFRRDFRDYYQRRGWSAYTAHNLGGVLQLTGRYQWDQFYSLDQSVKWGLFEGNFGREAFRPNPPVDEDQIRSLRADVQLDTRDRRADPGRGWFANALFERAGGFLGGDARFKRYLADVRRYQPLGPGARLDLRLRLGTAKRPLPRQYLYDLGGYGTLQGYGFKEFTGDRVVLFNAEYWIDADRQWHSDLPADGLHLGAFLGAGSAWFASDPDDPFDQVGQLVGADSKTDSPEWKTTVGLALGLDSDVRLYASRPLDGQEGWVLSLRFSRSL